MKDLKKEQTLSRTSLLLGVFCCDGHQTRSQAPDHGNHYPELHDIRQQIEQDKSGPQHRPYSANKKKVLLYQTMFILFGMFFMILAGLIFFKTTNWSCSMYFSNCMKVKTFLCTLSMILSLSAFFVGFSMRTEKEAVNHLSRRALMRLAKIYCRKKIENGLGRFFSFGKKYQQAASLKQSYVEMSDKVADKRTESLLLIERIKNRKDCNAQAKEDLYNQAILELHDQLHEVIHNYSSN